MYTALTATSLTLENFIEDCFVNTTGLAPFFDTNVGGSMEVSLHTPQEMSEQQNEGLSVWLYRVVRDEDLLNQAQIRITDTQLKHIPLPVRLHYLITPIINTTNLVAGPELEQTIIGKVLQIFHDYPLLRGGELQGDLSGTSVEIRARLEPLGLEEITRVWDALEASYQLSVSYEVSVIEIHSAREPENIVPVDVVVPEYGVIVG